MTEDKGEDILRRSIEESHRKERREGIGLIVIGAAFFALGVFLGAVENPWMGAMSAAFGAMGVIMGIVKVVDKNTPATRIATIVGCFLFAVAGAFMILSSLLTPGAWGWRSPLGGIIGGVLALGFFGPGTVILIIKEIRIRRR